MKKTQFLLWCLMFGFAQTVLQAQTVYDQIDKQAVAMDAKVIEWRRDFHQNPELSNREFKTAEKVATHLRSLGLEVRTGVAKTGVIGILRTGKPGPVVGLRADMDGLPVVERVKIPFASKVKGDYRGEEVGVMHACGHDTHVAMLMGAASILTGIKSQLAGTVVFIFQPAEEGPPPGESGGAKLMVEEGLLKDLKMNIVFGQHISSIIEVGNINIRPGGLMAAADRYVIKVKGKQTHGSQPWAGVDPVTVAAQIVLGLQTIVSRQMELTREAVVISVGKISGGVRNNIIPEEVELEGTIRTLDVDMQTDLHERIRRTATNIAEASGAVAEVEIIKHVPITFNNPELFTKMGPTLKRVCGEDNVVISRAVTGAEDFAFFANEVPSMFYFVGGMPKGQDPKTAPPHHTPDFYVDEAGMQLGVRLFCNLVVDYTTKLK
ncbi:amidohydrolase [Haliscomenobacter sp.]|uniref:amidohydrolase n=1 Tax=Haliscomenobacter sp. TaxID=2717303 RepID=UPI003592FE9C